MDRIIQAKKGVFSYIEVFPVPGTYAALRREIQDNLKDISVIIHAAHSGFGLDLSNSNLFQKNMEILQEAQRFADLLNAPYIIVHPGFFSSESDSDEIIRQLKFLKEPRLLVENLPFREDIHQFYGHTPDQIRYLQKELTCGFCFDFAHAVAAANDLGQNRDAVLSAYQALNPQMYHICDGDISAPTDFHYHFGLGNYPLAHFVNDFTPDSALVTLETGSVPPLSIQTWLDDLRYIQNLES